MVKPITPDEVIAGKRKFLPDEVIVVWNEAIARNWDGNVANIKQDDIISSLTSRFECHRNDVFSSGWLEIEDVYREHGWKVVYDKPAYYESYSAIFTFTKRRGRNDD